MAAQYKSVKRTKMGATNPKYAKQASNTGGTITYDNKVNAFSELVAVSEAIDTAEASFYSNNRKSESNRSFKGCTLTFDNKGLAPETVADVYGATMSEEDGTLSYGGADSAPRIGFGFVRELEDNGKRYYEGVFYPDCKASLGNASDNTRGENITYNGETTTLDVYATDDEKNTWKKECIFDTLTAADAWVDKMLGKST